MRLAEGGLVARVCSAPGCKAIVRGSIDARLTQAQQPVQCRFASSVVVDRTRTLGGTIARPRHARAPHRRVPSARSTASWQWSSASLIRRCATLGEMKAPGDGDLIEPGQPMQLEGLPGPHRQLVQRGHETSKQLAVGGHGLRRPVIGGIVEVGCRDLQPQLAGPAPVAIDGEIADDAREVGDRLGGGAVPAFGFQQAQPALLDGVLGVEGAATQRRARARRSSQLA
jgi:hypothetical protein